MPTRYRMNGVLFLFMGIFIWVLCRGVNGKEKKNRHPHFLQCLNRGRYTKTTINKYIHIFQKEVPFFNSSRKYHRSFWFVSHSDIEKECSSFSLFIVYSRPRRSKISGKKTHWIFVNGLAGAHKTRAQAMEIYLRKKAWTFGLWFGESAKNKALPWIAS